MVFENLDRRVGLTIALTRYEYVSPPTVVVSVKLVALAGTSRSSTLPLPSVRRIWNDCSVVLASSHAICVLPVVALMNRRLPGGCSSVPCTVIVRPTQPSGLQASTDHKIESWCTSNVASVYSVAPPGSPLAML